LKEEEESCAGVAKGSGTWPVIAGIKRKKKRKLLFPKISLKH